RLEAGGLDGGVHAEDNAQRHRDGGRSQGHPGAGNQDHIEGQLAHDQSPDIAYDNAEQSADAADHGCFNQKLDNDASALGADGLADADLPGALGDGDQHNVHNADAAHQQGDGGDAPQEPLLHGVGLVLFLLPGLGGVDTEVIPNEAGEVAVQTSDCGGDGIR